MNRNEFNRFIAGGAPPGPGDLEGLRELTVLFPWFHSAHMLLLRGLKENADIRFDTQLKASALSVSDREVLYHYLFMQPAAEAEKEEVPHEEIAHEEVAQEEAPQEVVAQEEVLHEEVPHEEVAQEEALQEVVAQEEAPQEVVIPSEEVEQTQTLHEEVVQEAVDQETLQEEAVHEEVAQMEATPATEAEASATEGSAWRTREELMAEIEARLEELSSPPEEVHEIEAVVAPDAEVSEIETLIAPDTEVSEIEAVVAPDAEVHEIEAVVTPDTEVFVTSDITEQEPAGEELLELVTDNESPVSEPAQQLTPQDLIDRFIQSRPTLERIPLAENQPVKDLSEPGAEEQGRFITETLAKIYINQGYYTRAINIYEKLSLQFPEKSAYFAGRIEKIKDLIK